jgi:2-polyprenyl-6-methoxyphenol hydroxylase-like FAD-dependent oxidoreductase
MKILISGAGIAGLTIAYWLREYGFEPVIVEQAPHFERKGFLIGIRGASITVLERMNLLDKALALGLESIHHDILSSKGKPINRSQYLSYKQDTRGKLPMNRADLHAVLYDAIRDTVQIRFGTTIEAVRQHENRVDVYFAGGEHEQFDLLIGADGIHSTVRRLVFGDGFEFDLNASYAAFVSPKTSPISSAVQFARGRMSVVYDLNQDEFGGIFIFKGHDFARIPAHARKAALILRHDAPIADALSQISNETYIFADRLVQIDLPRWSEGRVVLVGDAAYGLSPASGFGATAAIAGAYILAGEIGRHGLGGLTNYEGRMRAGIDKKRKSAARTVTQIVSENPIAIAVRDFVLRLMPENAAHKAKAVDDFGIGEADTGVTNTEITGASVAAAMTPS